ncbi:strawberry notch C-terminal domain-containing protein [Aeromonas jandaei]|uniref:strawberry notch C-terminal domain-containing protein n=1 Tax=Aeromonas jandaei TaxID=650 RepID=UPI003B9F6235
MNWLQLTEDNNHVLVAFRTLSNDGYIAIAHPESDSDKIQSEIFPILSRDGFELIDGILVKKGQKLSSSILKSAYPNLKPIEVGSYADITINDERHKWIQAIAHKAIDLGYNSNGDKVLETFSSQRIVKDSSTSGEGSAAPSSPADLLIYDGTPESLASCADAFVIRLARRAQPATYADLERFANVISQRDTSDALMRPLQEAIEAALYRYIAIHCPLNDEGFLLAQELYSRQPRMEARTSSSIALQQYSTPVHLSMIVQNIIGDVGGHTVVEPTIGNGSLVSLLPPTAKVVGCDLDEQRLFQTRQLLETIGVVNSIIQVGDATKVDFRHLNGGEPVRAVIGNPPFGGLPAPVKMHGVKINKIDHQILINALDARSDKGVGAFIIGADSYIESQAGMIDGSSKWLFNYLADHYQMDAVEVSGKVAYSRQGASYPIRIVVIGDRFVEPIERVITDLPVINSMGELWQWSCRMREKYGLADVYVDELAASPLPQQDALTEVLNEPVDESIGWVELAGMRFTAREQQGRWTLYRDESALVTAAVLGVQNTCAAVLSAVQSIHDEVGNEQEFISLMSSPFSLQRDGMKVAVADHLELDVPAGWLVCNATRPLVGDRVVADGPLNDGRFYALIDPESPIAASYLKSNEDLNAKILVLIPKETQIEMVLANNEYAEQYRNDFEGDELYSSLNPMQYLYGKTYREIGRLKAAAENKAHEMQQKRSDAILAAKERSKYIASSIVSQLGKGFAKVTGAKHFVVIENGLSFDLPKKSGYVRNGISRVKIILGGNDLYDVVGFKVSTRRGVVTEKEVERHEDVYAEMLIPVMEEMTNLACIMPTIHAPQYGITLTPDGPVPYQDVNVDSARLPEVISGRGYHGSLVPNIERLVLASGQGNSFFGQGIYVTTDRDDALDYASTDPSFNRDLVGRAESLSKQYGIDYNEAKARITKNGGTLYEVEYHYERPFILSDEQSAFEDKSALRMALSEALVPEDERDLIIRQLQRAEGKGNSVLDVLFRIPTKGQFVSHYAAIAGYDALVLKGVFALRAERHNDRPVEHVVLFNDNQVRIERSLKIDSVNEVTDASSQANLSVLDEYVAELQANMKRVASELPKHRISLADLEGAGCGAWYQANVNGRNVRATDRLVLLSDRYPSEVESLIERGDLPVSSELKSAPLLDEVLSLNGGERLTVQGITRAQGDSLALLTDTDGEGYLIDEALIRLATRAYADVNFIAKRGLVELQDLNGDPLGFITPRSSPSRIEHADLYRQLVRHTLGLPLPLPKKGDDKKAVVKSNTYQTGYQAASRVGPASSMLPVNLETPLKIALQRVIDNHGDIDEYVAGNLSWSVSELGQYLSPEQVDAVALALFAAERGRGFLEGDQTGLGKGRVMAAMARYAALQGRATIFLTETPTLFSDLWRDISDIGSADLFRPFIVNSGVPIFDVITGKRVIPPTQDAERKRALEDGVVPDGCNLVLGTYSQFNREAAKSLKARWLPRAAEGAVLLMDESHNAAGESNTGENLSKAVAVAETVVYSSATSMKDAKNVMIYSKLFPESVNLGSMPETLAAGGEVLQEVLSSMLAEDGVFIRREHDLSNVTMITITDHAHEARNRDLSDRLASILELMNYLAGDINQLVNARNKEIKDLLERLPDSERKGNRMGAASVNFGSRLFNLYRQFLMAIKVDATVELAKSAVAQGQKPVIILENTMESLLKETILSMTYAADDEVENAVLEDIEVGELTFRDVLTRTLERISSYQESDRYGNITRTPVSSDEALELIGKIQDEIDQFPYLAVSPIDEIVRRLEKEGIFCDELSGRKTKVVERDGKYFAASIPERPKATIVNDFNSGRSDALFLSRAGSTGISLHASEKFRDQRQRFMIELQSAADVNKRVQFFGRVNRKGQVNEPIIGTVSSGLPGEARPIAMQNAKLRKLSANTTSNQDNAALDDEIPDFLNKLGDRIARQYLENNPSIANRLDIDIEQEDLDGNYFINRLTSRIMMLRVEEQELIYDELTMEFNGELARLDAIGENPLRSRMFDIKASEVSHEVETHGNPYSDSVFDRDIIVRELAYTEKLKPLRCDRVKPLIEEGLREIKRCELNDSMMPAAEFLQGMVSYIVSRQDSILRRALPRRKYESVEAALADSEPNAVHKVKDRLRFIAANLQELMPGRALRFSSPAGDLIQGIVVGLRLPEKREQLDSTGKYELAIAVPGQTSLVRQSFYSLAADPAFSPLPVYAAEGVLRAIDDAPQGEVTRNLTVLDGNLFGAAQRVSEARIGRSALYTDEVGQRQRAMMLSSGVTKEHLAQLPVRVATARIAAEVLRSGIDLTSCQAQGVEAAKQRADHVTLSVSGGELQICVPGSVAKGGHIFKDSDLVAMTGEFRGNRSSMQAKVPASFAEPVLERLYQKGISLFAPSSAKREIDDIKMSIYANDSCNKTAKSINMK